MREHQRLDIIGLVICAGLYKADRWLNLENYGRATQAWLKGLLRLPRRIACQATIVCLCDALKPAALKE